MSNSDHNNSSLKIFFWNTRSINKRLNEIMSIKNHFDIIICVETWLTSEKKLSIPGFVTYRKDRDETRGGGIAVFLRKSIAFKEIPSIKSPSQFVEMCAIEVTNSSPSFEIIIFYRTPTGPSLTQAQWDQIVENVNINKRCLLVGDFNAHHTNWNCKLTDSNGSKLLKAFENKNLFLHNTDTHTHLDIYRNQKSNIDLIFSSTIFSNQVDVKVCDETWGSDHFPIFIDVGVDKFQYVKKPFVSAPNELIGKNFILY